MRSFSIRQKLLLITMASSAAALLLVAAAFLTYEYFSFRLQMKDDMVTLAQVIGDQMTAAVTYNDRTAAKESLKTLVMKKTGIVAAGVYTPDGLFVSYCAPKHDGFKFPARPQPDGWQFGQGSLAGFQHIFLNGEDIGAIYINSDLRELHRLLWRCAGSMLLFAIGALLAAYVLATRLQRIISRPISQLAQTADAVSREKNYTVRAQKESDDELGRLIDGFNGMLAQIQERDSALQRVNDELERRVQERTQDLEKAYDELRKTQQAVMQQERLKALGQMASGIAHDINNALSPIVGFSELLGLTQNLGPEAKKQLGYIQAAGEDITHIVTRLREFYRLREENEALQALDLNRLAGQVIDMAAPRWRDIPQGRSVMIEMKREFDPQLPKFAGVESEIREALLNLIINAVDALPAGGVITIRTRSAGADPDSRQVLLEVCDTGIGMDELTRKRCLEPFFSTKGQRGTGLGLAMVYGIVERHRGSIEIESQPGQGTTMRLLFPARAADLPAATGPEKDVPPGPFHILCVDDEPTVRELIAKMLRHDGHQVETADSGRAGLAAFRAAHEQRTPFDVVLTDLGMPYMDGREFAALLKSEFPKMPVIMCTGWGAFMEKQPPPEIDGIVSKPPRFRELRAVLRELVHP